MTQYSEIFCLSKQDIYIIALKPVPHHGYVRSNEETYTFPRGIISAKGKEPGEDY